MKKAIQTLQRHANWVPLSLTTLRLVLGPVALWWAASGQARIGFVFILLVGLLSDIFDGVLARKLGVSTPALRRYDSLTDVIFYLFVAATVWGVERGLIAGNWPWVVALLGSEAACIAVSLLRFGCLPATHSWMAKFYGLVLFATFVGVLCFGGPAWMIPVLGTVGLVANVEILVILFKATRAPVDVLTLADMNV